MLALDIRRRVWVSVWFTHPVSLLNLVFERFDIVWIFDHTVIVRPIERQQRFVFFAAKVEAFHFALVAAGF